MTIYPTQQRADLDRRQAKWLKVFHEMYGVWKYQLELYAGALEWAQNHAEKMLKDIVEEAAKDGVLDHLANSRPRLRIKLSN